METKNDTLQERITVLIGNDKERRLEAARVCDVDISTVAKWISGKLVPSMDQVKMLAEYFSVNYIHLQHGSSAVRNAYEYYKNNYIDGYQAANKEICDAYGHALIRLNTELLNRRVSSDVYNVIMENSEDELYVLDKEFNLVHASKKARARLGYSYTEIKKLHVLDIKDKMTEEDFNSIRNGLIEERDPIRFLTDHKKRDGRTYQLEITIQMIKICGEPHYVSIGKDPD